MKQIYALTTLTLFGLMASTSIGCSSMSHKPRTETTTPPFLTGIRQVTFAGLRAGEGYFSHDGQSLVFQSEREAGNPFYQIYKMNLKSGRTTRLSPGQGKTTCAWLHPDGQRALFASTHADPQLKSKVREEWENRKAEKKSKYSWSFDDQFDIYQVDMNGKNLKNLTRAPGYDAEASYSPDGKWIAFASNRQAYLKPLSAEDKKIFDKDASYMMDIYIMRADGTDVKQLTHTPGYDGGPFFSPDGKRITFRRFTPDGMQAEVHTIAIDGTDDRALTRLKAMSWAPFYHPSGDYLIFTTNKMGYANFELYIVDLEGKKDPVRVSELDGFDGLPVFTPDGRELYWTHSNEKGEAQIYRAEWNDALARQALGLGPAKSQIPSIPLAPPATNLSSTNARKWVEYLASEKMQGRMTGGQTEEVYMNEIAKTFGELGLKPVGAQFIQSYEFTSGLEIQSGTQLQLHLGGAAEQPKIHQDWTPLSFSSTGEFAKAGLTFVGYGITAPAGSGQQGYNSFQDLDVKDKWVVAFSGLPEDIGNERRFQLHLYSHLQHKAMMARQNGARGLILIDDSATPASQLSLSFEGRSEDSGIPVIRLSNALADHLFATEKTSRKDWTAKLARGETGGFAFHHATAQATVGLHFKTSPARNVIGQIQVPGAKSTVMIGAHGDHLGFGEKGNSLWRGKDRAIHLGADDNASGVAGVLELARQIAQDVRNGKLRLKQNIAFAVWSGEEIGILGSTAFLKSQPKLKLSAYLNMDMIGRMRDQLMIQGTASSPEWGKWIEEINAEKALNVRAQEDPYLPTDALAFYLREIPVLSFFTGSHSEYHMPTDSADRINYDGLVKTADWAGTLLTRLASQPNSLTYRKVESNRKGEGRGFRLYLGTIPDYSQDGKTGVMISGTSKGSPAEKAGLQPGDIIVNLGGMKVQNLNDFVYCLQALKANVTTPVQVLRKGVVTHLEITPSLRTQ